MIDLHDVTKYYGERRAIEAVTFHAKKGEIVGLLGPNGAGKTTTMRIITGYLMPTSGQVSIDGYDMSREPLKAKGLIGYLPERDPAYVEMKTRNYLRFLGKLRGLSSSSANKRIEEVAELCGLPQHLDTYLFKLSKGLRQRVGLAQAILHNPSVLILDEPTIGIDPRQVYETRQMIANLGKQRTILLSTHILPEVEMICDRVAVLHNGHVVAFDRIETISSRLATGRRLKLRVEGPKDEVTQVLRDVPGVDSVLYQEPYHVTTHAREITPQNGIVDAIVSCGWTMISIEPVEVNLEELFLELTSSRGEKA